MPGKKRLRKHKHRTMERRLISGKKPMSAEQKLENKKARDVQRERTRKDLESKRAAVKKKAE